MKGDTSATLGYMLQQLCNLRWSSCCCGEKEMRCLVSVLRNS